jgi:uncharacterized protein YutE (UPF0331/DUF86 family)
MKNTESKSRRLEKQVRNLREQMTDLSATMETLTGLLRNQKTTEVDDLSYDLEESRDLLYDIKEMLEDKLIIGEPTSSGEVLRIWKQRDPFDNEKSARVAIISAWNEALELRALVRQASAPLRERFIRLVRARAAPADIQSALGDCPQPDLGNGRNTTSGELAFEQIKTAWLAATVLRTVLSEVPKSDRERFIGLLRVDASPPSSEAD